MLFDLQHISLNDVYSLVRKNEKLSIGENALNKIEHCFNYLHQKLATNNIPIYGINTGFGSLCNSVISNHQLEQLQENLVKSHACGTGNKIPDDIANTITVLKIINMSLGHSGVSSLTVSSLCAMFNNGITPVIYEQGSLGASGDLAPLAHLSLPLIGLGEVIYKNKKMYAGAAFELCGISPVKLQAKEGLALLNGTQFMCAYGVNLVVQAQLLFSLANQIASLSLDAYDCRTEPFLPQLQNIRKHKGQNVTAAQIRELRNESAIANNEKFAVQDPYSFRCIPQVHGAVYDVIEYAASVFETEINAVTDNPTIFPDDDLIVSGGNFHGETLAITLDSLAIALAELGSISERRTYKLISGTRNLSPFLANNAGLNSGYMIPQYTAASIVSQNKQLCTPASVDTIDSSNGQEDHVSMGANAATKCMRVLNNVKQILAIEMLCASQAVEQRLPLQTSPQLQAILLRFRKFCAPTTTDEQMNLRLEKALDFIENQL